MTNRNLRTASLVGVLLLGFVAVAASAALAQPPGEPGRPSTTPSPSSEPGGPPTGQSNPTGPPANPSQGGGPPANATGKPSDLPGAARQPGRMTFDDGLLDGRYVEASYDEANGTITSFTVNGVEYFASIQAPGNFSASGRGAQIRLEGDGFVIAITDNPSGLLRVHAPNMSVELTFSAGVTATANGTRVEISAGNESAALTNATLEGDASAMENGLFMLHGKSVASSARSFAPSQARIDDAIADGRVAARVEVLEEGAEVLDFQGANVEARRSANGNHRFVVDADFASGRAFVVDFAPGLLKAEELGVLYYDEVNGTLEPAMIQRADSLEDVLLIEAGEGPEYWHVDELAGEQVIVAVPSFSVHAFDVYPISGSASPMVIVGIVAAVVLVAVVVVITVRGRRQE